MLRHRFLLPILAGAIALGGCDDLGTAASGDDTARVSLLLTDAPGDFRAAVVTITDIYLQGASGDSTGRVYLRQDAPVTTDLLTLSNDVLELVDDRAIPAGRYAQLRFVISGGYLEVEGADGASSFYSTSPGYAGLPLGARVKGELKCPGCAQSGFKVLLASGGTDEDGGDDAVVLEGDQTLLVDFDVSQSFGREAGRSGKWMMRPTLKATALQSSGSVTVSLALADTTVHLPLVGGAPLGLGAISATLAPAGGGDAKTVALTDSNGDGVYEATFQYLLPGDYQVGLAAPAGVTLSIDRTLPFGVTIGSGASARVDFRLLEAG